MKKSEARPVVGVSTVVFSSMLFDFFVWVTGRASGSYKICTIYHQSFSSGTNGGRKLRRQANPVSARKRLVKQR